MEKTNYIVILKLQYVLESSGWLVKTQTDHWASPPHF